MKIFIPVFVLVWLILVSQFTVPVSAQNNLASGTNNEPGKAKILPYLNPALPVEQRIDDLIGRMNLEEKIGQLNMPCVYEEPLGATIEEKGGAAIADILFGDYNPEGKLSITIPRHAGQLPVYYNYKPSKSYWIEEGWGKPYADLDPRPLFTFGFGLSYTEFEYSNLTITPESNYPEGAITVSADVKNTGSRTGAEVVQLYLHDRISSVVTPVMQLRGFNKIKLEPGEKKIISFILTGRELQLLDENLIWRVEPGIFDVMIGSASDDIHLKGSFTIL